jgi:hypothetical protein
MATAIAAGQLVALLVVAGWAAATRRRGLAWLAALSIAASCAALWSATGIEERIMDHQVFWISAIGALNLAIFAGALGLFVLHLIGGAPGLAPLSALANAALVASVMFVTVTQLQRARAGHLPVTQSRRSVTELADSVRAYLGEQRVEKPLFRIGESVWGTTAGFLLELDRAGVPLAIEDPWMPMFPQKFTAGGDEDAEITVADPAAHAELIKRPGNVIVADAAPLYIDAVKLRRGVTEAR